MQTRGSVSVVDGRYELEHELGRGPTGMVWRARDLLLGRTVTLKVVHPSLADDAAFTQRLAAETRLVASLNAPGIVRLLDTGVEDGVPYLVREHVEGVCLRDRLDRDGPLDVGEAIEIASGVLEALVPAHGEHVFHLDLSLDDVIVCEDGAVRVTDMGIGAAVTATRTPAHAAALLGVDGVAPEQRSGTGADARTDVFAVAAMAFELLTGEPPGERSSARGLRPDVPRGVDRVIARALSPSPDERPTDARTFAESLLAAMPDPHRAAPRRGILRTWLAVPIVVAVIAIAVIIGGLWVGRLEVGGPLGIRSADGGNRHEPTGSLIPSVRAILPASVTALDPPPGDGSENSSGAPAAIDGDRGTAWRSEDYFDASLHKPGMGLIFDLGASHDVVGFRLWTPHPGYVFHVAVGDDPDALVGAMGDPYTAIPETRGVIDGTGRYVLIWITTVVDTGDGHRAEIAEFRALVTGDA